MTDYIFWLVVNQRFVLFWPSVHSPIIGHITFGIYFVQNNYTYICISTNLCKYRGFFFKFYMNFITSMYIWNTLQHHAISNWHVCPERYMNRGRSYMWIVLYTHNIWPDLTVEKRTSSSSSPLFPVGPGTPYHYCFRSCVALSLSFSTYIHRPHWLTTDQAMNENTVRTAYHTYTYMKSCSTQSERL